VLTGDKMETAVNIAYSSGILDQHSKLLEIRCEKDLTYDDYNSVIIEGDVLASL
jgi:magnesium-transporting ATPase (P-type)